MRALTADTFWGGRLVVQQHRDGYRFSIDAVLLAAYADPRPGQRIVDLGTGSGIIAMLAACRQPSIRVVGVELQPAMAELARRNVRRNQLSDRVDILHQDLRRIGRRHTGSVDLVVANPPFRPPGSGRINPDAERAAARHEILATLADFVAAGRRLLDIGGRFAVIYPAVRGVDLLWALRQGGLEPKRMRSVHSHSGDGARLILVQAVKGAGPALQVDPPLTIYQAPGVFSPEVAAMLAPAGPLPPVPPSAAILSECF